MEETKVDQEEFRAGQRRDWNQASEGWREWSDFIDRWTTPVSERLTAMARLEPGQRVLDVAAGYGEPSLTAARIVGPQGSVVATDISPGMLAYGRERAAGTGMQNVEFIEADAASLDFAAGSFDAALSRWGIIFEPDAEGAAGRIREFLRPGGRMAISSWGPPERVPFMAVPMVTLRKVLDVPPPPPGVPGPLSRPTRDAIAGLLEGGGFSGVEVEELEITFEYDSPEAFASSVRGIVAPIANLVKAQPPEVQDQVWQAIADAAAMHAGDDGTVRFTNLVLVAAGQA
ncbi:MAG TPA: methyltransferase domain-containing protein [Solirubrobacteraceae bacterium]|nr:methyltransferase domain-containing protein [Solirubrobacteraceae bacterium]